MQTSLTIFVATVTQIWTFEHINGHNCT